MPTVSATSAATTAGTSAASTTAATSQELQARFLKLLTTQLSNQDPLNPMDNAEMTSQLAQLSMVDGIERLNSALTGMASAFESQAVSMVGRTVLVPGSTITLKEGASYAGFELPKAADKVQVQVFDASGTEIERVDLGSFGAGVHTFNWDGGTLAGGTAASGNYRFKITATQNGNAVSATQLNYGTVGAVTRSNSSLKLSVGEFGDFEFSQIRQYL